MLNSIVIFTFSDLDRNNVRANMVPKMFYLKFGTRGNSDMVDSMVMFTFLCLF